MPDVLRGGAECGSASYAAVERRRPAQRLAESQKKAQGIAALG
jgi:hypothetical protein